MKNIFFIICIAFLTTSCSRLEVAYKFADHYATSKVDDFFDLTSQQKKNLKASLKKDLNRARVEMFPELAIQLEGLRKQITQPQNQNVLNENVNTFKLQFWKFAGYFKNTALVTAKTFTAEQFAEFDEEVTEELNEARDFEEAKDKLVKRYRRNVEMWVGGISKAQRAQLEAFTANNPYPFDLQVQNKEHLLRQFQKARVNPTELESFIQRYFDENESLKLPAYTEALQAYHSSLLEFAWKEFWPSLTDRQKKNLDNNLKARIDQLQKLAAKKD